jgi:hypothetical protein
MITLAENYKLVTALAPVTTNAATTGDYVSLKDAKSCTIIVNLTQAAAHATAITIEQATAVAGTGHTAITVAVPIWANEDVAATDTLVKQTSAVSYTVAADVKNKLVVFHIDPATLDIANGFDCITVKLAASSEGTNFVAAEYLIESKYAQATPPAAITD